ncbi:glycosyltransferase [Leptolyngbya sp. PCC 6406]|uniref:glycosyltransferase n=1 Tax=Leptolyngbya sp. PCC 6406 TaxID=1173264 RepID=UPI0002AC567B|nr:glycosyltransferase [Leptolyngbya sp. PCC 6406]
MQKIDSMRPLYFLLPGTSGRYLCGGLFAELKTLALVQQVTEAAVVTYRQREPDTLFLSDVLKRQAARDAIFVVSWGFDVPKLVARLRGRSLLHHAHSAGYGFRLPASVPILTVSRNTMGYWGQRAPNAPIYYLPNHISEAFCDRGLPRDIDVLVQGRKSSQYLLNQLVPALEKRCRVVVLDSFVEDLGELFNRAKVYLYDSAEHWAIAGVSEGFGLPPMEALACGCQVFSSVNHALADYLDPGFNCEKIGVYSTAYDVERILAAVANPQPFSLPESFFTPYRQAQLLPRCRHILKEINHFFDHATTHPADVPGLSPLRQLRLQGQRLWTKGWQKLVRS